MGSSTPVLPSAPKHIARRQGLIFGGGVGIIAVMLNICLVVVPAGRFFAPRTFLPTSNWLIYLLAFIAFFFAGWRAAQQTGRIDIGSLAGFWAGLVAAVVGIVIDIMLVLYNLLAYNDSISSSSLAALIFSVVLIAAMYSVLGLLLGAGLGALGGLVGRTYVSGVASPPPSLQPPASSAPPQASQPPAPPQNQP